MAAFKSASAGPHQFLLRLNGGLGRLQIRFRLHAFLIGCDPRFRQFDGAAAVARGAVQRGLRLQQLRLGRRQLGLRVGHIARSRPRGRLFGVLHLRDFVLQAGDRCRGRSLLRLQFRRIEHRNQISGFHRRAFVHQQFLDAASHLRAHDHLVGVDRADQHQVARVVGGKVVVGRGDREDDSEKNKKLITRAHERAPCVAFGFGRNNAAEMKSSTAARRSAIRSGVSGLKPTILCIMGALLK